MSWANRAPDFRSREHGGQARRGPDAGDGQEGAERSMEDVGIEENEGAERLILCGGADLVAGGEVGEEGGDLRRPHRVGVAESVVPNVTADPVAVGGLGALAISAKPAGLSEPVEQARCGAGDWRAGVVWACLWPRRASERTPCQGELAVASLLAAAGAQLVNTPRVGTATDSAYGLGCAPWTRRPALS